MLYATGVFAMCTAFKDTLLPVNKLFISLLLQNAFEYIQFHLNGKTYVIEKGKESSSEIQFWNRLFWRNIFILFDQCLNAHVCYLMFNRNLQCLTPTVKGCIQELSIGYRKQPIYKLIKPRLDTSSKVFFLWGRGGWGNFNSLHVILNNCVHAVILQKMVELLTDAVLLIKKYL